MRSAKSAPKPAMLLTLQKSIIYGPVPSRRLGISLGINILPFEKKSCTFNCQYCQYGWTTDNPLSRENHDGYPTVESISTALENYLSQIQQPPAYLTFSGNGEPTLHPHFEAVVDRVLWLRNKKVPASKVAILSNSTGIQHQSLRETLQRIDKKIMKLDVGNERYFSRFNQPARGISLEAIINGLCELENLTLQSLFAGGPEGNFEDNHIQDWLKAVKKIDPAVVQLYTLDRTPPSNKIFALRKSELDRIRIQVQSAKIKAAVF